MTHLTLIFLLFHVNPLTLHTMKNMHRSKEARNTSQSITGRQFIHQKRDAALSCLDAGCRLQWRLIHAYWKHPIEMKLPISTLKPATFDAARAAASPTWTSRRLCHQLTNDQGCDLLRSLFCLCPESFFSLTFLTLLRLTPVLKSLPQVDSPPVLAARSRSPRPLSVVEVAWQQFSPSRLFGEDGDTSAWGSHAP